MPQSIEATLDYKRFCQSQLTNPYTFYHQLRAEDPVHFSAALHWC